MKTKPMVQNEELIVTQHPDYTSEVVTLLRSNLTPKIKQERILSYHENDIAAALDLLTEEERNRLYLNGIGFPRFEIIRLGNPHRFDCGDQFFSIVHYVKSSFDWRGGLCYNLHRPPLGG